MCFKISGVREKKVLFTKNRRESRVPWYKTSVWRKIRALQLKKKPLCEICLAHKEFSRAVVCDHIDPTWETWNDFIKGPFQSLCHQCHKEKTREDIGEMVKKKHLEQTFFDI